MFDSSFELREIKSGFRKEKKNYYYWLLKQLITTYI